MEFLAKKLRRKILAVTAIACCFVPALARAANLDLLHASVLLSYSAMSAALYDYQRLPCVSPDAGKHLANLQKNSNQVQSAFSQSYREYVNVVKKPMEGDGRCDGGFSAVVVESEKRREKTESLAKEVARLSSGQSEATYRDFEEASIDMPDDSEEQTCIKKGNELYDAVSKHSAAVNVAMASFQMGVQSVERNFRTYVETNKRLGAGCGSMNAGLASLVNADVPTGKKGEAPELTGDYKPKQSGVSGSTDDSYVPNRVAAGKSGITSRAGDGAAIQSFDGDLSGAYEREARAAQASNSGSANARGVSGISGVEDEPDARAELLGKMFDLAENSDSAAPTAPKKEPPPSLAGEKAWGDIPALQAAEAGLGSLDSTQAAGGEYSAETVPLARQGASEMVAPGRVPSSLPNDAGISTQTGPDLFELVHRKVRMRERALRR